MAGSRFKLQYKISGSETGWQELNLDSIITIGRNPDCDLILSGSKVSRQHATISIKNNSVILQDLNSSNGTFLDGNRLAPQAEVLMPSGSIVKIGDAELKIAEMAPKTPAVSEPVAVSDPTQSILWYRIEKSDWKQIPFDRSITIGRDAECGLALDEGHVSRNHCTVTQQNGVFTVSDLGSHNGTYLEGVLLKPNIPVQIYPGQYFSIGRVSMTIANAVQQKKYQKTAEEIRLSNAAALSPPMKQPAQQVIRQVTPLPKKSPIWPWLVGIGLILMMCVCGTVLGVLVFINDRTQPVIFSEEMDAEEIATELAAVDDDVLEEISTELPEEFVEENTVTPELPDEPEIKWLVMLYQNGDDEVLEYDIVFDVNTAEYIGSTDEVKIVTQLDRFDGAYDDDGDWAGARRYEMVQDSDLYSTNSPVISDLGEVDSGDVQTLVDFVIWAIDTYPAQHYVLILSDHGGGWFGGYTDGDNGNTDGIYLPALESALDYIIRQTGIGKFDLFGFDACLMAQIEVWSVVAPYAEIGVASEETESSTGWAYAGFLGDLVGNPAMTPQDLAVSIVDTFVEDDLMYQVQEGDSDYAMSSSTLSAIDLEQINAINFALNDLSYALQYVDQSDVAEARSYSMSYVLFSDTDAFFLDLVNFGEMACSYSGDDGVCTASEALSRTVASAMIAEKHGSYMEGSNGITFYYPDSSFFEVTVDDTYGFAYRQHAGAFTSQSLWDEFLDFHYLGRSLP